MTTDTESVPIERLAALSGIGLLRLGFRSAILPACLVALIYMGFLQESPEARGVMIGRAGVGIALLATVLQLRSSIDLVRNHFAPLVATEDSISVLIPEVWTVAKVDVKEVHIDPSSRRLVLQTANETKLIALIDLKDADFGLVDRIKAALQPS